MSSVLTSPAPAVSERTERNQQRRPPLLTAMIRNHGRCGYCGVDLLESIEVFALAVRDHLMPRHAGGPNNQRNLVLSCAMCDRLKGGQVVGSRAEARKVIAAKREEYARHLELVRQAIRESR